jgi:hypothetical protein
MSIFKFLVNHNKKGSFVNQFRQKRFDYLKNRIEKLIQKDTFKILDIGGDIQYWKNIGWQHSACKIHLLNLYTSEIPQSDTNKFTSSNGDGLALSYENQQIFANEVMRVSDKYIIQTPSLWFPLEPHSLLPLFQFLPHPIRALLIMTFNINYFPKAKTYKEAITVSHSTLMFTHKRFKQLFPDAEIQVERFLGIPKSYTAIKL